MKQEKSQTIVMVTNEKKTTVLVLVTSYIIKVTYSCHVTNKTIVMAKSCKIFTAKWMNCDGQIVK